MAHEVIQCEQEAIEQFRLALTRRIGQERMDTWITMNTGWRANGKTLSILGCNAFALQVLQRRMGNELRQAWQEVSGEESEVLFEVDATAQRVVSSKSAGNAQISGNVQNAGNAKSAEQVKEESRREVITRPFSAFAALKENRIESATNSPATINTNANAGRPVVAFPHSNRPNDQAPAVRSVKSVAPGTMGRPHGPQGASWDSFVFGPCNELAAAAAAMVLGQPGCVTPLLLHGPSGCGKSHLAQAIGNRLRQQHGYKRVVQLSSEHFTNDYTEAVRSSGYPNFRRKYRDIDALVLDDIQFFLGKKMTLQELKHTLDTLIQQGKQVILVSDRSRTELTGLGPELHARISGGMACALEPLDVSTREQLLARLANDAKISLAPQLARSLAEQCNGDARMLFGVINRLRALSLMLGGKFTEDQAYEATSELLRNAQPSVRLSDIERAVCDVFGLEPKSLQTKGKGKTLSQPRMLAMFLARKYTRAAYAEIGDYFGHRRHSTVISAEKKVAEWLKGELPFAGGRGQIPWREAVRHVESNLQVSQVG